MEVAISHFHIWEGTPSPALALGEMAFPHPPAQVHEGPSTQSPTPQGPLSPDLSPMPACSPAARMDAAAVT